MNPDQVIAATAGQPATVLPQSAAEVADLVRSTPRLIAVGGNTKSRLTAAAADVVRVSTAKLTGIVDYEPTEFTFTAKAGTPLKQIIAALAERGQYLPFDPMLADAGATLGGTVASGLSGPGRLRFGSVRDFILGVQFVDGLGRVLRLGGRVVKNAAGFDVPKFFVGSAGRFGVMTEITFKVFPRPASYRTLRLVAPDMSDKVKIFAESPRARWEVDAVDAGYEEGSVYMRVGAPEEAMEKLTADILKRYPGEVMTPGDASYLWQSVMGFRWAFTGGTLLRAALTPVDLLEFVDQIRVSPGFRGWISAAGDVVYLSVPPGGTVPEVRWAGMTLRGNAPLWIGPKRDFAIIQAVKTAFDPEGKFPALHE